MNKTIKIILQDIKKYWGILLFFICVVISCRLLTKHYPEVYTYAIPILFGLLGVSIIFSYIKSVRKRLKEVQNE